MAKLSELNPSDRIHALVYGRFKTGKTAGAATFPRPRIIMFDMDGWVTLKNPKLEAKYGYAKNVVDVATFYDKTNPKGIVEKHNAFDAATAYFDEWMKPQNSDSFDTWVIDSGTTLFEVARNKGLILLSSGIGGMKSETLKAGLQHGIILPKQQDYGAERSMAEQFIDMVLKSGKHVVLLCHEREVWDEKLQRVTEIVPLLTGQSVERVSLKFTEVWNLRNRKSGNDVIHYLQTEPDGIRQCGSRLGLTNETLFEWSKIQEALKHER